MLTTTAELTTVTLQNLGESRFKNWYLDISGSTGDLMLSEQLVSGAYWKLDDHGDGIVSFQNLGESRFKNWYLDISGSTGDLMLSEQLVSGAYWKLDDHGDGTVSFQNLGESRFKNWYLDISGSSGNLMLSEQLVSGAYWKLPDISSKIDEIKKRLEDYIKDNFAVGNKRNAHIEEFELRGIVLYFKVRVQSKEEKREPVIGLVTVYSLTYHVEGNINLIIPDPDKIEICVDAPWPVNKICRTGRDIAAAILMSQ
ncbi:RICIN domain-containing protein [Paenibacillus peoriae]|uniref:RICIN domain-containing protein n=1 Tax=Paenibacillus peoriae TaxID=59893 RepID=UPI00096EB6EC|nr:RICIN domain-containing protein [Paenibacillus peoriae]OMF31924.1 hypothetical protein BK134_12670 [Paenibacillus peoriae]